MPTLDLSALTALNPKEVKEFSQFIAERTYMRPELRVMHNIFTGVTMKEQIILAGQMSKSGLKKTTTDCSRMASGAGVVLTEKFWEPVKIEDSISLCADEMNALFKAYYDKIASYKEIYEIEGSDAELFIAAMVEEAMKALIPRAVWLGDTAVAAAGAALSGLAVAGNAKFYNYFDGIWKQLFAAVTAGTVQRVTIAENALGTIALQETLADDFAVNLFNAMWAKADPRLRADLEAGFHVSGGIFENYRKSLQKAGENFTIEYTTEGFQSLKWNGKPIVNMETVWDLDLKADFLANTTDNTYFLPNRALLTTKANIPIGTLNENDFSELDTEYVKRTRMFYIYYGFTLDAKVLEGYMSVVAY